MKKFEAANKKDHHFYKEGIARTNFLEKMQMNKKKVITSAEREKTPISSEEKSYNFL
jgi:hypothetical protein